MLLTGPAATGMNEHDKTICDMMGRNMHSLTHSMRPLLVASGHTMEEVDRWLEVSDISPVT